MAESKGQKIRDSSVISTTCLKFGGKSNEGFKEQMGRGLHL